MSGGPYRTNGEQPEERLWEKCQTCRWFEDQVGKVLDGPPERIVRLGICRRYPPGVEIDWSTTLYGKRPATCAEEWCGEWQVDPDLAVEYHTRTKIWPPGFQEEIDAAYERGVQDGFATGREVEEELSSDGEIGSSPRGRGVGG